MKYSEKRGEKPFDWDKFLRKRKYTQSELNNASELSRSWVTCACGNQCDIIPRNNFGTPDDYQLWKLGQSFFGSINMMKKCNMRGYARMTDEIRRQYFLSSRRNAKRTLKEIEARSIELVNKIKNGKSI